MWIIEEDGNARNTQDNKRIFRYEEGSRYGDPPRYIVTTDTPPNCSTFLIDACKTDEEAKESIKHIVEQINDNTMPGWFYQRLYNNQKLYD